ncbi:MAG: bifunctional [glutamate--ammonia ligase]-adenylyl-L-tyrosine phosphorylase/[glutamate--ammonia-ligase] adenylyltransferase [Xanthomonadales bacterium]
MSPTADPAGWNILPPATLPPEERLGHVRGCSDFAAQLLDRFPDWIDGLDEPGVPTITTLSNALKEHGLETGLRRFRNREMLRIVWRDLCGTATLGATFASLTRLAELCLQAAIEEHERRLVEKHGTPRGADGRPQRIFVIGLGKFGGGELNLSSDIDIVFCYPESGSTDGRRSLDNDPFFTRLARAVIASLAEITEDGFCFRVDTRLRPFGTAGPLTSSLAALEQYYQREGRDWERYALIKARPVAGDREAGNRFIEDVRPFVYRRYIDYSAIEALQEMHANVQQDARRKDRLDDIKRGPGGIREIEFLAQSFQILRGGREPALQTPSLDGALSAIEQLGLLTPEAVGEIRNDYAFLRLLENRIQALRDQQTHRLPADADRARIAQAMAEPDVESLETGIERTRRRVGERFGGIFPNRPDLPGAEHWNTRWQQLHGRRQDVAEAPERDAEDPLALFVRRLDRIALSQRANQRLNRFMPGLLQRLDERHPDRETLNRVFDLVLAICRRSAYLVLLVQYPKALDRMLGLFERSAWIAAKVIRFPALLDELIDPALGRQLPERAELEASVDRILLTAQGPEAILEGLNYLKLATELRVAVGQLQGGLPGADALPILSDLAAALLRGVLIVAGREIEVRHGRFSGDGPVDEDRLRPPAALAVIGYGSLGAAELGYGSDLDLVFLFEPRGAQSDGARPLAPEQYFARLAQRVLSFLTVMTPSGRLYDVDTRLRPNGRAGSLVSGIEAFREYQLNDAWTWELQALTRARFIAGSPALAAHFTRIRQDVLCRERDEARLAAELGEMRERIRQEQAARRGEALAASPKHGPGGLVDIEFATQLGVLASARRYPRVIRATGTRDQLQELAAIGWLDDGAAQHLRATMDCLRQQRLMAVLVGGSAADCPGLDEAARIVERKLQSGAG